MSLATILHHAARQGLPRPWTLRTTKRRIRVRFAAGFIRGRMLVAEWSRRDRLEGSARA